MEKRELLKAITDVTKQFVSDSNDLLKLASKAKAGVMQTQISSEDLVQYYKDAILDCLKKSNQLINDISKNYFNNDYKATLSALSKVNSKDINKSLIENIVNLITNLEKNKTRKVVVLNALKNINDLYFKSPADMSGLKRSIVDLDKISKMKSESMKITKTKTLLEQAKEILFSEASQETAYLKKLKKLNPGWDPEKAKTDFENEYDEDDPEDISNHVDYEENAAEWLDNISSFTPGVKVGDWVEAYVKNAPGDSKICIGKIVKETTMEGHDYGWMGYKGPKKIPAWDVQVFAKDQYGDYKSGEPNDYVIYDNIVYMNIGKVTYIQHDEIQSNKKVEKYKTYTKQNTFKRLPKQNLVVKTIK